MNSNGTKVNNVDTYIAAWPQHVQVALEKLRSIIKKAAPEAEEVISYQMPAYKLHGMLVYFAAYKNHIGFYPTASGINAFKKELVAFETSKGTVKLALDQALPSGLISRMVKFRVRENSEKARRKSQPGPKTCPKGHRFFKSSDCPTCPTCEKERKPQSGFLSLLSAPARRALENAGIVTLTQLSGYSESEILSLHGLGKTTLPKLREALKKQKLAFKKA